MNLNLIFSIVGIIGVTITGLSLAYRFKDIENKNIFFEIIGLILMVGAFLGKYILV